MIPGIDIGTTEEPLKHPALPNEVPSPGLPGSSRTTSWPLRTRKLAAVTPTIPAPMTPIVFLPPAVAMFAAPSSCRLPAKRADFTDHVGQDKVARSGVIAPVPDARGRS